MMQESVTSIEARTGEKDVITYTRVKFPAPERLKAPFGSFA